VLPAATAPTRSPLKKGVAMKTLLPLLAATASLALAAPAVDAATSRTTPQHRGAKVTHRVTRVLPSIIVVEPPFEIPPGVDPCSTYMADCTEQQYCDLWGFSCDLVPAPPVATTAAESPEPN
jgi:hypothetical protein